ncbi:hypothetical protein [Streptomyces candidus]|uniref:Uncharacterized protein n=1 Tax=Streptomyces candidus TaxID=67283 RepID=A0A7X0HGC4_9ACTN|nr:hypothetical protein [Streptomyces candidus]MBB6435979.1 hypothetical protein [Streptomyces candidus]GHH43213.1 hypothetical protein GCM10018773_28840 [Streptomyces candidus]
MNVCRAVGQRLELSNGGTEVFIDVLMLAVSDLADEAWDYRFAALLTLQDQHVGSCARHRVLSALPHWEGCFLCHR